MIVADAQARGGVLLDATEALGHALRPPLRAAIARNAERHAQDLAPVVEDIQAGVATSLRAIAAELWHVSTVTNLLDRLGLRETAGASAARCY